MAKTLKNLVKNKLFGWCLGWMIADCFIHPHNTAATLLTRTAGFFICLLCLYLYYLLVGGANDPKQD